MTEILNSFGQMSDLEINKEKSALLGLNCVGEAHEILAREIGCGKQGWPITYLGVPQGGNQMKMLFWEPVLSKISTKLANWMKAFLSKGGD